MRLKIGSIALAIELDETLDCANSQRLKTPTVMAHGERVFTPESSPTAAIYCGTNIEQAKIFNESNVSQRSTRGLAGKQSRTVKQT